MNKVYIYNNIKTSRYHTNLKSSRSSSEVVEDFVLLVVVSLHEGLQLSVISDPLCCSRLRRSSHQAVCDLLVGQSLLQLQRCKEAPDGRIRTLDQAPEPVVPS